MNNIDEWINKFIPDIDEKERIKIHSRFNELIKKYEVEFEDGTTELYSYEDLNRAKLSSSYLSRDAQEFISLYPLASSDFLSLSNIETKEILEWINNKKIPNDIYKDLSKDNSPLPSKLYIDSKTGKAWSQFHFRGIESDKYKAVISGEIPLWRALIGQSIHIDLRIDFGLDKLVQYVITENNIQSMVKMMRGDKRETKGGIMNVQHSKVVSKPSGEPPEGPDKFYKSDESYPSIDEEGAKLAEKLIIKDGSYWIEPGQIGSTKNTYSYMALIWLGNVSTGCERHDLHELFLSKSKANDDIFNGKFTIKCLKGPDDTARWEIWKSISNLKPLDPIMHSDIGYHYLIPASKVDGFGREDYIDMSQSLYKKKLK